MLLIWTIVFTFLFSGQTTQAVKLYCCTGSTSNCKELPIKNSTQFVNTEYIPKDSTLILVFHGYSTFINQLIKDVLDSLLQTYDNKEYGICAVDWSKEATAYLGPVTDPIEDTLGLEAFGADYPAVSAIAGTVVVDAVYDALIKMHDIGLSINKAQFIGHSEGAHISGNIGKKMKENGFTIALIIGLDPAKPPVEPFLTSSDAKFVYSIHTNPRGLGTDKSIGIIDFWINYGCKVQPKCPTYAVPLTSDYLCSHKRALVYIAEAFRNPNLYQGRLATSYDDFLKSTGTPDEDEINYIGPNIKQSVTGNFYLNTGENPKYGLGADGMDPSSCKCCDS